MKITEQRTEFYFTEKGVIYCTIWNKLFPNDKWTVQVSTVGEVPAKTGSYTSKYSPSKKTSIALIRDLIKK